MVFVFNAPMLHYIAAGYFCVFKVMVGQVKCSFLLADISFGFGIKDIGRTMYPYNSFDTGSPIIVQNKIIEISLIDCSNPVSNTAMCNLSFLLVAVAGRQCFYQALYIFQ
jgi:hypothetical protein